MDALTAPVEVTLNVLIAEYGWAEKDVLESLADLTSVLSAWNVECIPPIGEYGLDEPRVLRQTEGDPRAISAAEIAAGENDRCEFKASLILDWDKHTKGGIPIRECASPKVLLSCIKTIAGFLNADGGILYIGVRDDGSVASLPPEYELTCPHNPNFDQWELFLRGKVEQHFHNGRSITASIAVSRVQHDHGEFARVQVGARKAISFVNWENGHRLYVRTGNRTLEVPLTELEQYYELKRVF